MATTVNKTQPTARDVGDFLSELRPDMVSDSKKLIALMREISGGPPIMWGPSIIGFGRMHYRYDTGREGDTPVLAFSPRKTAITIYFSEGFEAYGELLPRLGKYTTSVSCLYVKKLADIDESVLKQLLARSFEHIRPELKKPEKSVESYIANVPAESQKVFSKLRNLALKAYPDAEEVLSYGVVGYRYGKTRPVAFISGWKDHVAVYPIPHDEILQKVLKPYAKGKGTLWFPLDKPLPEALIMSVFVAHQAAYLERTK